MWTVLLCRYLESKKLHFLEIVKVLQKFYMDTSTDSYSNEQPPTYEHVLKEKRREEEFGTTENEKDGFYIVDSPVNFVNEENDVSDVEEQDKLEEKRESTMDKIKGTFSSIRMETENIDSSLFSYRSRTNFYLSPNGESLSTLKRKSKYPIFNIELFKDTDHPIAIYMPPLDIKMSLKEKMMTFLIVFIFISALVVLIYSAGDTANLNFSV